MGASTVNRGQMDAARRQQAMEGQTMRRRALQQQEQYGTNPAENLSRKVGAFNRGESSKIRNPPSDRTLSDYRDRPPSDRTLSDYRDQEPQMRSGINFGPGRANRIPEQGSPEYERLLQRVRGLNQGRR